MERRAHSIHLHVTGESGPSSRDVANASMRVLSTLFGHSNGMQAGISLQATLDCFNDLKAWSKIEHCRWVAIRAAEWTQYQYRYAIPTKLVECLVQDQDTSDLPPARRTTLAVMVTSVFTSPIPLVNMSTSDIISSLITAVLRRISKDPDDPLLPALVQSISSLGTHVYYADQIQDLAGELISRLVVVETSGVLVGGQNTHGRARVQAVRCLLAGLFGLLHAAEMHDDGEDGKTHRSGISGSLTDPSPSASPHPDAHLKPLHTDGHVKPSRRTSVMPEVWQETLTLLCDSEYPVRADYASILVSYLQKEIPKLGDYTDADGVKRMRLSAMGPTRQEAINISVVHGDSTTRFLHALHAHVYILATSSKLGVSAASTPSPQRSVNEDLAMTTMAGEDGNAPHEQQDMPDESRNQSRRSLGMPRTRKMSAMKRLLRLTPAKVSTSAAIAATLSDYGNTAAILSAIHEHLPIRGLLTGVPMLLALEAATQGDLPDDPVNAEQVRAIRGLIVRTWGVIGRVWDSPEICQLVEKALSTEPSYDLPNLHGMVPGAFQPPQEPSTFANGTTPSADNMSIDSQGLLTSIVSNKTVQDATGLDRQDLLRRFTASWSAESAFRNSVEDQSPSTDLRNGDGLSPLVKVTPALMHIENLSRASLARSTRGVGVTDLREALEGRSSLSNPNLTNTAASLSTLEHSSVAPGEQYKLTPVRSRPQRNKLAGPADVKDVLNKLGIGKANTAGMLKPSFSAKKPEQRSVKCLHCASL
ncbi:hypothetical protein EIP86_004815 [Pleurotus ostreatoroseus]|nr:hypothetical protein EIP86_004815 [Pleurotus ostreatoroseus]